MMISGKGGGTDGMGSGIGRVEPVVIEATSGIAWVEASVAMITGGVIAGGISMCLVSWEGGCLVGFVIF